MGEVIKVAQWGGATSTAKDVQQKMISCDRFIRSRFSPPQMGSVVFNFATGKVTVTGECTSILGEDCEIVIRDGAVQIIGDHEVAGALFCAIHREIELLNPNVPNDDAG